MGYLHTGTYVTAHIFLFGAAAHTILMLKKGTLQQSTKPLVHGIPHIFIKLCFFGFTAATIGAALALEETVQVNNLTVPDDNGLEVAAFKPRPANVDCSSTSAADLAADTSVTCGTTNYRSELRDGSNGNYLLRIHK
ncbi:Short-chain dehydrogenase/reductase SDR [Macrophomina phaseolina MS6]|uniref:Short-chain dehydrogenase/reductase SDR n=1 Tax=Macrophomina phaseolina (strain MS6) TaxID=1126212 RepID=K2S7K6_MACPH|nr:Short-chain dehydrogenase/reductase SDR [Macrophomina phaseolina MS6]